MGVMGEFGGFGGKSSHNGGMANGVRCKYSSPGMVGSISRGMDTI
jgi:hypothetical protein